MSRCPVVSCKNETGPSFRLCMYHTRLWQESAEGMRAFNGPGGTHAESMFADFVVRIASEVDWFPETTKHDDCDCMSCRPP